MDALLDGTATFCISAILLDELHDVLGRDKFRLRLGESGRAADEIVADLSKGGLIVDAPNVSTPASLRDPDDTHVLACGTASGADAIVTGDTELLALTNFQGIPILTVQQALERLGL